MLKCLCLFNECGRQPIRKLLLSKAVQRDWRRKLPLRLNHVWRIRIKLKLEVPSRDPALFNLAIDSKLRGCDVVTLPVDDVAPRGCVIDRAIIRQRKTGRPVKFEPTEQTHELLISICARPRDGLGNGCSEDLLTLNAAWRHGNTLVSWGMAAGVRLDPTAYGMHSLRRAKAILIHKCAGNLRGVQLLLGHPKIESTVWYLGIEVDDALEI